MPSTDLTRAQWRKSTKSTSTGDCIEAAGFAHECGDAIMAIRDSKDPSGPALVVGHGDWSAFVAAVRQGQIS